jgi:hypothetical protein
LALPFVFRQRKWIVNVCPSCPHSGIWLLYLSLSSSSCFPRPFLVYTSLLRQTPSAPSLHQHKVL